MAHAAVAKEGLLKNSAAADGLTEAPHVAVPNGRAWAIATLLAGCYTLSYFDRQAISILVAPIKASLHLSDTQFGLLQGISFSIFYVLACLPLAWLADRYRRSRVMSACVAFWSVMTMLCALTTNFWQLLLARIGLASGESGLTPAALATLSARFDPRRLATATSMFMLAPFIGGGMALAGGGALYASVQHWDLASMPILGHFEAWQIVFFLIGLPGLVAAGLLLLIVDRGPSKDAVRTGAWEVFGFFKREWRFAAVYSLTMGMVMTLLSGYVTWLPAAIMRSKGIDERTLGALFGPIYLLAGAAGTLSAGIIIMYRGGTDPVRAVLRYMSTVSIILWPIAALGLMASVLWQELALMGFALFLISSVTSLSSLPFQYVTPPHLRAQAIGLLSMVAALFGTGLGPVLAGILSDHLTFAAQPLSLALSLIGGCVVPVIVLMLYFLIRHHRKVRLDVAVLRSDYPRQ
jgi:MFS family permease